MLLGERDSPLRSGNQGRAVSDSLLGRGLQLRISYAPTSGGDRARLLEDNLKLQGSLHSRCACNEEYIYIFKAAATKSKNYECQRMDNKYFDEYIMTYERHYTLAVKTSIHNLFQTEVVCLI